MFIVNVFINRRSKFDYMHHRHVSDMTYENNTIANKSRLMPNRKIAAGNVSSVALYRRLTIGDISKGITALQKVATA